MIKYYPIEELCKKLEVYLKNMIVIPETPFSGGLQPELTHQGGCGSNQLCLMSVVLFLNYQDFLHPLFDYTH